MYGLLVGMLALVLLILCWIMGDCELRTKLIVTGIYLLIWPLIFINDWLLVVAQGIFAGVVWWLTFGSRR